MTDLLIGELLGLFEGLGLRNQISTCELDVEIANDQPRSDDAGAKQEGDVDLIGHVRQGGLAHGLVAHRRQLNAHHHRQGEDERRHPDQRSDGFAVTFGPLEGVQRLEHGKVAFSAHDGQGEDAGVHGEEVHADQNPTARLTKVPSLQEVGADHEGDGEQVEQVRQGQVDDVNVHGGGRLHGVAHDDQRVDVPRDSNEAHDGEDGADGEGGGRVLEQGHGRICAIGASVHQHF